MIWLIVNRQNQIFGKNFNTRKAIISISCSFRYAERFQTQMAIRRMKLWNSFNNFLGWQNIPKFFLLKNDFMKFVLKGKDDLLISANVDEMMSRQALVNLKHCQTTDDVISAALWMPMGNFNRLGMIP